MELTLRHILGRDEYATNTFIITEENGVAAVIDPAGETKLYMDELKENNATLKYILLTHGHDDHTGSVKELREKTGAQVCIFPQDAKLYDIPADLELADGQLLPLSEETPEQFQVVHTPGHTPGSCCFQFSDVLFSGDTLFANTIGRTDMENGNHDVMLQSLKKLYDTIPDKTEILPGHGPFTVMYIEKERNSFLQFDQ